MALRDPKLCALQHGLSMMGCAAGLIVTMQQGEEEIKSLLQRDR